MLEVQALLFRNFSIKNVCQIALKSNVELFQQNGSKICSFLRDLLLHTSL